MEQQLTHNSQQPAFRIGYLYWSGAIFLVILMILLSPHPVSQYTSLLLLMGIAFILLKRENYQTFLAFFFTSIIVSKLLVMEFLATNGTTYIGGGDDQLFNDLAIYFTYNEVDITDPIYLAIPYKLYLYLLSAWIKIVSFFSNDTDNNNFHSVLLMLNSSFGALVAVNVKIMLTKAGLFNKLTSFQYLLTIFNPFILYYSAVLFREILMVFIIISSLLVLLSEMRLVFKIILILFCFSAALFVRPVNSVVILMASFMYAMQNIRSNAVRIAIIGGIAGFILLYLIPNIGELLGRDVSSESLEKYSELTMDQASDNSIGAVVVGSKNPIIQMIVPVYVLFSPIPPPIVTEFTFRALVLSLGSISWFVSVILFLPFIKEFYKKRKEYKIADIHYYRFVAICTVVGVLNILMVAFSSHDPRHNLFVYPLIIPMALRGITHNYFEKYKGYFITIIMGSASLIFLYIIYKLLS